MSLSGLPLSIKTRYNGQLFKSKLEADWARFFDRIGMAWQYEHEGQFFGETFYLVDFYLPRSRQYVEVKGQWSPDDCRKVMALLQHVPARRYTKYSPDITIIAAMPKGVFYGWERTSPEDDFHDFLLERSRPLSLAQCLVCRGWWFMADGKADHWMCQCCGASDGNSHVGDVLQSPLRGWPVHPEVW